MALQGCVGEVDRAAKLQVPASLLSRGMDPDKYKRVRDARNGLLIDAPTIPRMCCSAQETIAGSPKIRAIQSKPRLREENPKNV